MKHNQGGFTLVEMMVTIVIGSLVTLAATTVLLLGLRINNRSTQTVVRQNTARVVVTMLENLVQSDEIAEVSSDTSAWTVKDADGKILAQYIAAKGAIYAGGSTTPIIENVIASHIVMNENKILTFLLETEDGSYSSSVYCRTMQLPSDASEAEKPDTEEKDETENQEPSPGREILLEVLKTQLRLKDGSPNPGLVLKDQLSTGRYYSEWYLGGRYDGHEAEGWNSETPWCACFISYGLCHDSVIEYIDGNSYYPDGKVAFANVDFFKDYFQKKKEVYPKAGQQWEDATGYTPVPGDVVFIDWDGDRNDPAHVGVVSEVSVDDNGALKSITTIEGNSAGIVAVRKYTVGENYNIVMGYGVIDWIE